MSSLRKWVRLNNSWVKSGYFCCASDAKRQNGYLSKEIFSLGSPYGTAGDGDDRQGNGPPGGMLGGLLVHFLVQISRGQGQSPWW
jgi:hypothetical protein